MRFFKLSLSPIFIIFLIAGILFNQLQAQDVYPGWAFYATSKSCYLYDMDENRVHTWTSSYSAGAACRLMRDSSVMFNARDPSPWNSGGALTNGRLQIIKWDGTVAWDFKYTSTEYCPHHNIELVYKTDDPKETPNVLVACYTKVSGTNLLVDKVVEIKPTGQTTADIVWEWHAWDHRTTNGNDVAELLDEDASTDEMGDWTHLNSISYNRDLDQLVFGLKHFREFVIVDHSTTTAEAAGHTGGQYGKGGDILYRWGRPSNYGCSGNNYLSGFHSARWVDNIFPGTTMEVPGAGNVIVFQNEKGEANEIEIPGDGDGIYPRNSGEAFAPDDPLWTYDISSANRMEGSVQRLPNGNTFICNAGRTMYEVTQSGQTVWSMNCDGMQAFKYALTYFDYVTPVKDNGTSAHSIKAPEVYSNPATGRIHISFSNLKSSAGISVFTINGKEIFSKMVNQNHFIWDARNQSSGIYICKITIGNEVFSNYINTVKK